MLGFFLWVTVGSVSKIGAIWVGSMGGFGLPADQVRIKRRQAGKCSSNSLPSRFRPGQSSPVQASSSSLRYQRRIYVQGWSACSKTRIQKAMPPTGTNQGRREWIDSLLFFFFLVFLREGNGKWKMDVEYKSNVCYGAVIREQS